MDELMRVFRLCASLPIVFVLGLAGCSTTQLEPQEQVVAPKVEKPKASTKKEKSDGKYYKDDGPPEIDEVDWRSVPDPVVVFEPINKTPLAAT